MTQHLLPKITRTLSRRPAKNFADGITTADMGAPNYNIAMEQYEVYLKALRDRDLDVTLLEADARFPDGHFVEDPLILYKDLAFVCYSGAEARQGEADSLLPHLPQHRVMRLHDMNPDGRMDGGDVLICADRVLVGVSERTNLAGVNALREALQTVDSSIRVDAVAFSGVLHLKSGLTELAPNVLVHDPALKTDYDLSWATCVTLPAEEGYAADVMPINDTIFIPAGYPTVYELATQYYDDIVALDMREFQKMDGGLTCLSLRY
ncbi:MAG: arginine deiminase family protein [Chloroflexota bacterium]